MSPQHRSRYAAFDLDPEGVAAMMGRNPKSIGREHLAGRHCADPQRTAGPVRRRFDALTGQRTRAAGRTIVEVLVALAVVLLLARLAMPTFRDWIATQSMLNEARRLADSLHLARSEAIKSGYRVNVCKSTDRLHCTPAGGWDEGYIVYADTSRDGSVDADELIVRVEGPAPPGVSIRANHPLDKYVSFTSLGYARLLNGALQMGTFTLCRDGKRTHQIVIANSGRVRISTAAGVCS
jgi:type IV fimbrial biogenesis protein FimT